MRYDFVRFAHHWNDEKLAVKPFPYIKRLAIIGVALLGFIAGTHGIVRPDASNQDTVIVAQNETPTTTPDTKAPSSQGKEPETKTGEKKESSDVTKKPLENFQPSEKIEAEQAVDFPYDI